MKKIALAICSAWLMAACDGGGGGGGTDGGTNGMDSGTPPGNDSGPPVDSGPPDPPQEPADVCVEECSTNADCFVGDVDADFDCLGGRCRPTTCDENLDCVALLSQSPPCASGDLACSLFRIPWYETSCTGDTGCRFNILGGRISVQGACVRIGQDGTAPRDTCAPLPDSSDRCPGAQELIELPRVGASGQVEVCAYHDSECDRGVCQNSCSSDNECLMVANGWLQQCDSDADCRPADQGELSERRCIRLGSKQVCAQPAVPMGTPPNRAPECDAQNIMVDLAGGGSFVACGTSMMCEETVCVARCINDGDCGGSTPVCNEETGSCECGEDADCEDVVGHPACIEGACQCAQDADCDDFPNGDVCRDGACGCSGATACDRARTFDGTAWTCVAPDEI